MAILSKIRERSIALIAIIGLALFAFVLDPSTLTDFFNSSKVNVVGEIDGETISRQEFSERLDSYRARSGNRASEMQASKFVWDNLVREKIYTKQLEEAGITIGEEDIWNQIITSPSIANNPQFQNEAGLFDENKFKVFLKDAQDNDDQQLWVAWQDYMTQLGNNFKRDTYNNLLNAGLRSSLKEGEYTYFEENTKLSADYVYVPYSTVPDSTITVTKKDIANYIQEHPNEFQVEESRSLSYVMFDIVASDSDKEDLKKTLSSLIADKTEYNAVSKRDEVVKGFKSSNDYQTFFDENQSDMRLSEIYRMKDRLPKDLTTQIEKGNKGDIFGPYEESGFFKLLKVTDIVRRPDSVKSSHILIPFIGSASANESTVKTEEQAKKSADSIFNLVKRNKKKFAEIADQINPDGTKGKGGDVSWTSHANANSLRFDPDYANFIFDNKKGKVGVVKSKFGFHIIRIDDQKNYQKAYKTVVFGRKIEPSEATESEVFQKAEEFALNVSKGEDTFFNLARNAKYSAKPASGLRVMDEKVPGITQNARQIITWAFQSDTKFNDFKRFDLDKAYVVAYLTDITEKGLMTPGKAINKVRPLLIKEMKAKVINEKMSGATLEDIAKQNNRLVKKLNAVSLKSPSIPGIGYEPKIIGALYKSGLNKLTVKVAGDRGVYAFKLTKSEKPTALPNYDSYRQRISNSQQNRTTKVFDALKKASDIEDNRAFYYGIN